MIDKERKYKSQIYEVETLNTAYKLINTILPSSVSFQFHYDNIIYYLKENKDLSMRLFNFGLIIT